MGEPAEKVSAASAGLGERMRQARQRAGLTLDEVGKALGVTGGAVSRWESESSYPSRKNLEAFSRLVSVEPSVLHFAVSVTRQVEIEGQKRVPLRNPWTPTEQGNLPGSVECRFPCSPSAFAIEVLGLTRVPAYTCGDDDLLVIDPEVKPEPGDLVLVMTDKRDGNPGPALQYYWPVNAFDVVADKFLDAVSARISNASPVMGVVHNVIEEFRKSIPPNRHSGNVSDFESENECRVVGVVIEHTHGRHSVLLHRDRLKPDTQV